MSFTDRMKKSVYSGGLYGTARPAFRRVHYEFIAHTIKGLTKQDYKLRSDVADAFAETFRDVPGFDTARFLRACGVKS